MAAGVPQLINYQGRLTDGSGHNVADGVYTLAFRIYDDSLAGSMLWSETVPAQTTNGLLATQLGTVAAIPADLFSSGANRYLGVTVNQDPEMPRIRLTSVAYAYQAKDADVATLAQDLTCVGCVSAGEIANAAVGASEVLDGSLTALDIHDEPGVAGSTPDSIIAVSGLFQTLHSCTIAAPAAGYVLAIATAQLWIGHVHDFSSFVQVGVSPTAGIFPSNLAMGVAISSQAPTDTYVQTVTVHGLFSTLGGLDTIYFLGSEISGSLTLSNIQLTLIYFPTAHGTVVQQVPSSGQEAMSSESPRTSSVLSETVSEPVQAQVADPAGFRQDQTQVMADMEARIQKLEEQLRRIQPSTEEKR